MPSPVQLRVVCALSALLPLAGCAIDKGGLAAEPTPTMDADPPSLDAALAGDDAGPPTGDASGSLDASVEPMDAGLDAGVDAGPGCVSTPEECNGADDDCDGSIDEDLTECLGGDCQRRARGGRSYLFCNRPGTLTDWEGARVRCATVGYGLVAIEDAAENDWIQSVARGLDGTQRWWIGASDTATEGTFVWDATGAVVGYTNWNGGSNPQPNDDIRSGDEDWLMLESNEQGSWFDHFVQDLRFICEALP